MKWRGEWVHPHGDYSLKAKYKFGVRDWIVTIILYLLLFVVLTIGMFWDKVRFNVTL